MAEFTKNQLEEIKKQARLFWQQSTQAHDRFFRNTSDRENMAHSKLPQELADAFAGHKDRSCLAPPDFYINIASLRAAIYNLVFGTKPYGLISLFGAPNNFTHPSIRKAEAILQQMNDISGVEQQSDDSIHQALYAGMSAVFTKWTHKRVRVAQRDAEGEFVLDKDGNTLFNQEEVAAYAESIPIDIRRVRIDPSCDKIKDRRVVAHHSIQPLSRLLIYNRDPRHFYDFDEKALRESAFNRNEYYEYVHGETDQLGERGDASEDFGDKIVELKEFRGIFRVPYGNSFNFEDIIFHLGNDDIILGVKRNDLPIPGWEMYDFPVVDSEVGRLFPMGVIEPAQDLWTYKFLKHNQALDRDNRNVYEMYLAEKSAVQGLDEYIEFEGGKIIPIDTIASGVTNVDGAFKPLQRDRSIDNSMEHVLMLEQRIQQMMKLSDYIQGSDPQRAETATAVEALMQGGQSLLMHLTDKLKLSFWQPTWQKKLILYHHFLGHKRNQTYDQTGGRVDVNPNEINMLWQIDIDTKANRDRPSMIRRFVEMFPILTQLPYFDTYEVCRTAVQVLQLPNENRIIRNNELQEWIIDRENAALAEGVEQPVHEADPHKAHIEGHMTFMKEAPVDQSAIVNIQNHIAEHQEMLEKQNKGQLANTKELGGGSGSLASPGLASQKHTTGSGSGLKAAGRQ